MDIVVTAPSVEYEVVMFDGEIIPVDSPAALPDESKITEKTIWVQVDKLPELIFDHNRIIKKALDALRKEIRTEPLCFELLPKKFSIRQMQNLYEAILGEKLDNRNFRKKIKPLEFLLPLSEKEKEVSHKPAQLFKFDKRLYEKHRKVASGFNL
jgi:8-oxo-dGTP diphosphatase